MLNNIKSALKKYSFLFFLILITIMLTVFFNSFDSNKSNENSKNNKETISIITTIFPTYDFAREILGEKGNVIMLIQPGVESHSYEPTPKDIIKINSSDLFIYTGEFMEGWVQSIIDSLDNENLVVLDVSKNIELIKPNHIEDEGEDEDGEHEHGHEHEYDPHIWTDPNNCIVMVNNILNSIITIDPSNEEYYTSNANKLINDLTNLDTEIKMVVNNAKRNKIIFGSRFAFTYFVNRYGLDYDAAFDTCSSESEPSVKKITELINEINDEQIPVVYYEELSEPKIAKSIAESTNSSILLFHSCHNVSKEEFESGITYIDLMNKNIENLKKGLN